MAFLHAVFAELIALAFKLNPTVMAVTVAVAATQLGGAVLRVRSLSPGMTWKATIVRGAQAEVVGLTRPESRSVKWFLKSHRDVVVSSPLIQVSAAAALSVTAVLGLLAVTGLSVTGFLPNGPIMLALGLAAAGLAAWLAIRMFRGANERKVLARRSPHLLGMSVCTEVGAVLSTMLAIEIVTHAAKMTGPNPLVLLAIAAIARLAVKISPIPAGLIVADVVLVLFLKWISFDFTVAIAAAILWRFGMLTALALAGWLRRGYEVEVDQDDEQPHDSSMGRYFHRLAFQALGWLPVGIRSKARSWIFESMFSISPDPWSYADMPYEDRKRQSLKSAIGTSGPVVMEYGCADGHNLQSFANDADPTMKFIGVDISPSAIQAATRNSGANPNVRLHCTDDARSWGELDDLAGKVDVLILAEVLYYLGGQRAMAEALAPVKTLLAPDAQIILLHGASDASKLHNSANKYLEAGSTSSELVEDPDRPYLVETSQMSVSNKLRV